MNLAYETQSIAERREQLREEGKIELPLNVDTRKYLLSFIRYRDVLISLPLLIAGIVALYTIHRTGIGINSQNVIVCFAPWATFLLLLTIQHPDRKNISFFEHRIVWRIKYNNRQKLFVYTKGDLMGKKKEKDVREQLGISNIYSDCYETTDKRLVKVIKVSSINLSLLNNKEKRMIFQAYETFLNDLPKNLTLQISQIAQPVNLKNYFLFIQEQTSQEQDMAKKLLAKGYLDFIDDIQKSKNMVSRNRYVIVSKPFTVQNRESVLEELDRQARILVSQIENMLGGRFQLKAEVLNNEELFHLIYTCVDYENAQVNAEIKTSTFPITLGEETYREMKKKWEKEVTEKII